MIRTHSSLFNFFPADLVDEVNRANDEAAQEDFAEQPAQPFVFVVAHEKVMRSEDSDFIIEGVFHTLASANYKTMEIFTQYYQQYEPACFYAKGTWQVIGENSVGWYLSINGTLSLEIHDHRGDVCRIYAERHDVE
ncbi:hypothetical protein N7454_002303 [Penicillium verhagenii]|nr:hypothetical protein N7454_002303 [Penicillium verhagenii]